MNYTRTEIVLGRKGIVGLECCRNPEMYGYNDGF